MSGESERVVVARLADLTRAPEGGLERQYAYGEAFEILETARGSLRVRAARDGAEGWMDDADLVPPHASPTHVVRARSGHIYPVPDLKAPPVSWLPFGARLAVGEIHAPEADAAGGGRPPPFARFGPVGWVPLAQLRPLDAPEPDPVAVARRFMGTPYLWGGNGPMGLDCSGLVQAAYSACGIACPADSGPMREAFGRPSEGDPASGAAGSLVFWRGHVAMLTGGGGMIHANAHHMAVAEEAAATGIARIAAAGLPVIAVSTPPRG